MSKRNRKVLISLLSNANPPFLVTVLPTTSAHKSLSYTQAQLKSLLLRDVLPPLSTVVTSTWHPCEVEFFSETSCVSLLTHFSCYFPFNLLGNSRATSQRAFLDLLSFTVSTNQRSGRKDSPRNKWKLTVGAVPNRHAVLETILPRLFLKYTYLKHLLSWKILASKNSIPSPSQPPPSLDT